MHRELIDKKKTNQFNSPLWLRWNLDQRVIGSREALIEVQYESLGTYHDIYGPVKGNSNMDYRIDHKCLDRLLRAALIHQIDRKCLDCLGQRQEQVRSSNQPQMFGLSSPNTYPSNGFSSGHFYPSSDS